MARGQYQAKSNRTHFLDNLISKLYLSLNTVKAHTRNIYGKLGAHTRTQAVARARILGVLSSN